MNFLSNNSDEQSSLYISECPWYEMEWMASEKDLLSNSSNNQNRTPHCRYNFSRFSLSMFILFLQQVHACGM